MADVLATALWPANSKESEHWKSEVRQAISQSPLARARLGTDIGKLDQRRACQHLRQAIDPWDFGVSSWADKVLAAEATFALEATRPRRISHTTLDRIATAQTMLSQGLSRKAIAERLGMKPATLDRVLSRYAALRAPKLD